jgi:DNA-binding GntR family transcriptional regulator
VSDTSISSVARQSLSHEVYARIQTAIIKSELVPGEKVRDVELAKRLGLSRTPVREALSRLTDIGLIETKPAAYTRVAVLDRQDIQDTLDILATLDSLALATAIPVLTAENIAAMRQANDAFNDAVSETDIDSALTADDALHDVPILATKNRHLMRFIGQLRPKVHRILYRKFSTLYGREDTTNHHDRLIGLCERGDADAAADCSRQHWAQLSALIDDLFARDQMS